MAAAVTLGVASSALASSSPAGDPMEDPAIQKAVRAMANASTWYHPDLFGEFAGMRHYAHREYGSALKYLEVGAYYSDKFSQLTIGLMHLNGEGTPKDPVSAYAWIDLAAEREYPDFVATRDRLKSELTPEQLTKAMDLRRTLGERYGDDVAKPRLVAQLRQGQMQMTGSHTGFDSGVKHVDTNRNCGPQVLAGGTEVPEAGCSSDAIYAKERWEPELYFASRDRQFKASVTVGAVQEKPAAGSATNSATPPVDPVQEQKSRQH